MDASGKRSGERQLTESDSVSNGGSDSDFCA
jgi:hypothetical protein